MKILEWQQSHALGNMATYDAAPKRREPIIPSNLIDPDVLGGIEKDLEPYERLHCLFFLIDDYSSGYRELMRIRNNVTCLTNFVQNNKPTDWQDKVIEVLCLIQNNAILMKLGINPDDAYTTFSTRIPDLSYKINKHAKLFYNLFDEMLKKDAQKLIDRVYRYIDQDIPRPDYQNWPAKFSLELHLLWWIQNGFIKISKDKWTSGNLLKILKELNMSGSSIYRALQDNAGNNDNSPGRLDHQADNMSNVRFSNMENNDSTEANDISTYEINRGLVMIFNQMNFTGPTNYEYRSGSEKDCKRIVETFENNFGFEIETYPDFRKREIYAKLDELRDRGKNYDCVAVFLLSHGTYGKIIASDEEQCSIRMIESKICSITLKDKPKILVIQACQKRDEDLTTDGPTNDDIGRFADILVLNSTIPGQFSVRDRANGTWFIQVLCKVLVEMKGKSIHDCLIKVNECMKNKIADIDGTPTKQVSVHSDSLTKKLILPCRQKLSAVG